MTKGDPFVNYLLEVDETMFWNQCVSPVLLPASSQTLRLRRSIVGSAKFVAYVADVAVVADVAIVIDRKRGKRATWTLPFVKSRSIIGSKECSNEKDGVFFNILASAKYNTYNVYNTSNTCND